MKFEISKEDLVFAVTAVEKAISSKNTMASLAGIMITAGENQVSFRTTDLETSIEAVVQMPVEEPGIMSVPGRKLIQIAKGVVGNTIILESIGQDNIIIKYARGQIQIPCFSIQDYPIFPKKEHDVSGRINQRVFRRLVKQAGIAASADELRPVFTGMMMEINEENITFVATDTHRLSMTSGIWQGSGTCSVLVPNRVIQEVARLAVSDDDDIEINIGKSQIFFYFGALSVTTRLILGQFPDYRQVIPDSDTFCSTLLFSRAALVESLELATVVSKEISRGKGSVITLQLEEGDNLKVYSRSAEEGTFDEEMAARISGEPLELNYNARYLLDVLRAMDCETVRLQLTGINTPGVITSADGPQEGPEENDSFIYLILPVRVNTNH